MKEIIEFKPGDIVYHDNMTFNDNSRDQKKNRPCVVLFSIKTKNYYKVCTCPLISSTDSFNKRSFKYTFIPEVIYNEKKLSFASLENVSYHEVDGTHKTGISVNSDTYKRIIDRVKSYNPQQKRTKSIYNSVLEFLDYIELFNILDERENKKIEKQLKKIRRQEAKRGKNA